ncbi:hypothetical protein F5Y16DRAFT_35862 [Xylariaceae sp. FL0255]|nr:hypothetical protein F5Y16DRAFT_35862 [Xylariaceae sp. FL0255]
MAAVSLSPTPIDLSAMSTTRRVPLSTNQNVANSPLRSTNALKQKRTLAHLQREESYDHHPPPAKKQILDAHSQRVAKSPSHQFRVTKSQIPVQQRRPTSHHTYDQKVSKERAPPAIPIKSQHHQHDDSASNDFSTADVERIQTWLEHHRARFPKLVFYFDQVPSDVAHTLKKQISVLGGREAAFFSIEVTHIVTSRPVPTQDTASRDDGRDNAAEKGPAQGNNPEREQAQTINPSLLTRAPENPIKRRLFDADLRLRAQRPPQPQDQGLRVPAPKKSVDILTRAKDMGKRIWTVEKLQRMTDILVETDLFRCCEMAYGRSKSIKNDSRAPEDRNLFRLLQKERVNGPSDRDHTVQARELTYFKGPHIYVWDIEEKQKPIMVKEYEKVSDKTKGKWPQFQTAALGRCPFVEDSEAREAREAKEAKEAQREARAQEKEKETARMRAASVEAQGENKLVLNPPKMAPPKGVTSKRTLSEMEHGHNRQSSVTSVDFPSLSRTGSGENGFSRKALFTSHAANGRVLGGEPVASGVQPSNVTSAIRSQMISSTAATPGVITGISKEVFDLQRQVLKRQVSQDGSSRPSIETSFRENNPIRRPSTLGRTSSRPLETMVEEPGAEKAAGTDKTTGVIHRPAVKKRRTEPEHDRELKPGYCENCGEKYKDFEDHIVSKQHRRFAEDSKNWVELDDLLAQLERMPKPRPWKSTPS